MMDGSDIPARRARGPALVEILKKNFSKEKAGLPARLSENDSPAKGRSYV
jgi:hypothetical protein